MVGSHHEPDTFERLLEGTRRRLERLEPPVSSPASDCLSFPELRRLALRGQAASGASTAHLRVCARCSRLAAVCVEELPHLPWWVLLRLETGLLTADEERAARHHLTEGGCSLCTNRRNRLAVDGSGGFQFAPQSPHAAHAADAAPPSGVKQAGGYEVEVLSEPPRLELEIRTREVGLRSSLFGYALYQHGAPEEARPAYTPLAPEQNGWFTAQVTLADQNGEVASVRHAVVQALRPEELLDEEVASLLLSLDLAPLETADRKRWVDWLAIARAWEAGTHPGPFHRLLMELETRVLP